MAEKENPEENKEIIIGSKVSEIVLCSQCQKEVSGTQYYSYRDKEGQNIFLCDNCRGIAEKAIQEETNNPKIVIALILGLLAAVVAGILWFAISVLTGYQIGYIAIGVGYLIGKAVIWGSGGKRGMPLQIMSAVVTLATLCISQYFITVYYIRQYLQEHIAEFPGYHGQWLFVSPFDSDIISEMVSPIGLLIWAVGIYFAYTIPKSRSI